MYVIICFVRDHDTRFSLGFLHPALHSTQGDLYNTHDVTLLVAYYHLVKTADNEVF